MSEGFSPNKLPEEIIQELVMDFYKIATTDFMIGYHFRKIATMEGVDPLAPPIEAFSNHIPRIVDFWKMILLGEKLSADKEPFNLIQIHKALSIRKGEVGRWVTLFKKTMVTYENKYPEHYEFLNEWWHQVKEFEQRFLHSKVLFSN